MLCGSENLVEVCREKIAANPHEPGADGKLSWEEVECLGACANAPMAQIGKDYYEDLTAESFAHILDELAPAGCPRRGRRPAATRRNRQAGLTSLKEHAAGRAPHNASVALALDLGDTVKRIDGTEVPLTTPWLGKGETPAGATVPEDNRSAGHPGERRRK